MCVDSETWETDHGWKVLQLWAIVFVHATLWEWTAVLSVGPVFLEGQR